MCDTLAQYGLTKEDLVHLVEGPWRRLRAVIEKKVIDFSAKPFAQKGIKYVRTLREKNPLDRAGGIDETTEDLIFSMDTHGIEKACATRMKYGRREEHYLIQSYDDFLAALAKYPDRFIEQAYGEWKEPVEAAAFIRRRLEAGAKVIGEGIGVSFMEKILSESPREGVERCRPALDVAEEFDVPVYLGTRRTGPNPAVRNPEIYAPLFEEFPKVTFIIADGGGKGFPMGGGWQAVMLGSVYDNLHFEISGAMISVVEMAVSIMGAERVIFGSDQGASFVREYEPAPYRDLNLIWRNLNVVALANLSDAQRDLILHKNARKLLKLPS